MTRLSALALLLALAASAVAGPRAGFAQRLRNRLEIARAQSPDSPNLAAPTVELPSETATEVTSPVAASVGATIGATPDQTRWQGPPLPNAGINSPPSPAPEVSQSGGQFPAVQPGDLGAALPQEFSSAMIIARVGSESILASDVMPQVEAMIKSRLDTMSPAERQQIPPAELEKARVRLIRDVTQDMLQTKILYADAIKGIPKDNLPKIKENIHEDFEKRQLKRLMEKAKVTTRQELEAKLAESGMSIERQRQLFLENNLAYGWMLQHVKNDVEIPISDILGYYQRNIADYEFPAKARWEELMADFDSHLTKAEAYSAVAQMGNEVLRGASFAEVAKARSKGPTAATGGVYDWTSQGSLVSKPLDEAIFSLPVGRMSTILEDARGFHIVRVLERTAAGRKPFLEVQTAIRDKLKEERLSGDRERFMAKVKQRTPVWTIFDQEQSPATEVGAKEGEVRR